MVDVRPGGLGTCQTAPVARSHTQDGVRTQGEASRVRNVQVQAKGRHADGRPGAHIMETKAFKNIE